MKNYKGNYAALVKEVREKLNLNQAEFAMIFNVHAMTVSKWERDILKPGAWERALLTRCNQATQFKGTCESLGYVLHACGPIGALRLILYRND